MVELTKQRRGKVGELIVTSVLIKKGYDVYDSIIDDRGIDIIVRVEKGNKVFHKDIQVKHSKYYEKSMDYFFGISKSTFVARSNYYFAFVLDKDKIFIIPSNFIKTNWDSMWQDKSGNLKIIIKPSENYMWLCKKGKKNIVIDKYLNNFSQLEA